MRGTKKVPGKQLLVRDPKKTAAAYSPTWWGSTIGDGELNFSVRNGKRWYLTAIATAIYSFERDKRTQERVRAISTDRLRSLPTLHLLPINVVVSHDPIRKYHLEEGFALRCFQRLSRPNVDTRRCSWRHNRYTRGWSDPVLSY